MLAQKVKNQFIHGYNVGSYTITYTDGTVLDMSYDMDWNTEYVCIPEGEYTVCADFGGMDYGWFEFGNLYFYEWNIVYNGGD